MTTDHCNGRYADAPFCTGPSDQPPPVDFDDIPPILYEMDGPTGPIRSLDGTAISECEIYNECPDGFVSNCPDGLDYLTGYCRGTTTIAEVASATADPNPQTLPDAGPAGLAIILAAAVVSAALGIVMAR